MRRIAMLSLGVAALAALWPAAPATARNTEHFYNIQDAVTSGDGHENLLDEVAFYFEGQPHDTPRTVLGTFTARRSSRGAFRSDLASCQVAFLSALIRLQQVAVREGGDAIIDIQSITGGQTTSSSTDFRCVAGSVVVQVALKGTVVKLK